MKKNTITTYKLFRMGQDGKLYPLYVNANEPLPVGKWLKAKCGEILPNGKVKAKIGRGLAVRPGFHSSEASSGCVAVHIGKKKHPSDIKPSYRPENQVWARCRVLNDGGKWQKIANSKGKIPRDKCLKEIPVGGFYRYKTNPNMNGEWIISGEIFIEKVLTDKEVLEINSKLGVSDLPRVPKMQKNHYC